MYAVYHGPRGIRQIATRARRRRRRRSPTRSRRYGLTLAHDAYFDTLRVHVPGLARERRRPRPRARRQPLGGRRRRPCTSPSTRRRPPTSSRASSRRSASIPSVEVDGARCTLPASLPAALRRTSAYLEHPVFNTHQSETQMMRYLKQLADRDYALDRGMIPLGSCTMKLNAATEMAGGHLARVREPAPVRARGRRRRATSGSSSSSRAGSPRSPATTRSRCSRTPAARASSPASSRSAATTAPTARPSATSASSRRARTAPTRHPPCSPACASSSWRATSSATSTSTTCARRSPSTPTASRRS